jgi:hypothetical protein
MCTVLVFHSLYLVIESKAITVMSGIALGLGVIDTAMGLLLTCCGARSTFYLRLYSLVIGLIELAQIVIAALFLVPDTQQKIISAINPPADLQDWVENNLNVTGYILIAIVIFQAISLVLVFVQSCTIEQGFSETNPDEEKLLGGNSGYLGGFGYDQASRRDKKRDKFGALEDEGAIAPTAADRYRDKHSKYYSKYGLR